MKKLLTSACLAVLCFAAGAAAAGAAESAGAAPAADAGGFKTDLLDNYNDAADKLLQLAEAIPAEKYGWAPGEGVRSTSRVFMHVAAGNYFLASFLGHAMPEGIRDFEKETDKAKVIEKLKTSIEATRKIIQEAPGAAMNEEVDWFGKKVSKRSMLMRLATHAHEHLGQAIAYARSVGTAPPWSKKEG
jgi:uncharacterized damage-inducible protein DinB